MEKKGTLLFFHFILVIITWVIAGLTVAAWFAGITPPQKSWFITVLGLGMMPLLLVDVLLLIWWAARRKLLAIVPAAVILLNLGFVFSMFRVDIGKPDQNAGDSKLRIATYNIRGYAQRDIKVMLENFVNYIDSKGVDIVCFQEFSVTERFPLDSIRSVFGDYMPYYVVGSHNSSMSVALFSRYPIMAHDILRFKDTHNGALWADLEIAGEKIRVFNAHFQTTSINQSQEEISDLRNKGITDYEGKQAFDAVMKRLYDNAIMRMQQVNAVRAIMDTTTRKIIFCGDFNDTPASYTYKHISNGLNDGFRKCGSGYAYTFKPMLKLLRLDYIFYDKGYTGSWYYSPNLTWSDHNPVMMELLLRN